MITDAPRNQIEDKLAHLEYEALHSRYIQSVSTMGIEVTFTRCAKRDGGNIKKGTVWGKLTYRNINTNMLLSREQAISWMALPPKIKKAKAALTAMRLCVICGKQGIADSDPLNPKRWGHLRHQEHHMDICPNCIKDIYDNSHRPWEKN